VAIVAVDPSSPVSGGALLGDRVRMDELHGEERVYIRSLASRGHPGGLSRATHDVVRLLAAAGFDTVLVETVGAGQGEVEIRGVAHTCIVVCPPGLGDEVQALKAGLLEIADLYVVNKADLPGAKRTERELIGMMALRRSLNSGAACAPVLLTTATRKEGIAELVDALGNA
jgi:LAO/AO transport system kinase